MLLLFCLFLILVVEFLIFGLKVMRFYGGAIYGVMMLRVYVFGVIVRWGEGVEGWVGIGGIGVGVLGIMWLSGRNLVIFLVISFFLIKCHLNLSIQLFESYK